MYRFTNNVWLQFSNVLELIECYYLSSVSFSDDVFIFSFTLSVNEANRKLDYGTSKLEFITLSLN